ncbi:unnamed protein product [Paramecium sonneborni]|uniref:Uncharacterized protein n=1 Tax=Paramecium sonneborni TaxID=65129 RepID=A0A8S1Q2M7_9CILI|nr:unnamed protein product [Paramecium sonneborni]
MELQYSILLLLKSYLCHFLLKGHCSSSLVLIKFLKIKLFIYKFCDLLAGNKDKVVPTLILQKSLEYKNFSKNRRYIQQIISKRSKETIAYVVDIIDESLSKNIQYLEIKDYQKQAFKRLLINTVQNAIIMVENFFFNLCPFFCKYNSQNETHYFEKQDHQQNLKVERNSQIIQYIKIDYFSHIQSIQTTMNKIKQKKQLYKNMV